MKSVLALVALLLFSVPVSRSVFPAAVDGTIVINEDGSIDPPTAPIQQNGTIYTLTSDMVGWNIRILRDNITFDGNGHTLLGYGTNTGIHVDNASRVTVSNVRVRNFSYGIELFPGRRYNEVLNCFLAENYYGLYMLYSHQATIVGNTIFDNRDGLVMISSGRGLMYANNITNNRNYGIFKHTCYDWEIFDNSISFNDWGIYMEFSYTAGANPGWQNFFYHNNFINNTYHIAPVYSENFYDNEYPSGGNYWSGLNRTDQYSGEYQNETGSDGIGDTPYVMDENNVDNYPLMNPYWDPADFNHDLKVDIFDAVIIGDAYGSNPPDPKWNPLCDLAEPYDVVDIFDVVLFCDSYGKGWN